MLIGLENAAVRLMFTYMRHGESEVYGSTEEENKKLLQKTQCVDHVSTMLTPPDGSMRSRNHVHISGSPVSGVGWSALSLQGNPRLKTRSSRDSTSIPDVVNLYQAFSVERCGNAGAAISCISGKLLKRSIIATEGLRHQMEELGQGEPPTCAVRIQGDSRSPTRIPTLTSPYLTWTRAA